jgi:peptide/nickel transport system ATP-binding protein
MQESSTSENNTVLEVENLQISYETRKGDVEAIQGVSFKVGEAETVGLVGESGCGKSTIAFGIVNFLGSNGKIVDGSIRFQGQELVGRSQKELKKLRGDRISMVFQDPMQALNPSVRLGEQLAEVLTCHRDISQEEAWERCIQMLKRVNMPDVENVMMRYPHQISGGQQQRIVIAMAMLNNPALIIMDEPTTALDVTVEAAVLDLLEELKHDFNAANIFITHNLGVVATLIPGAFWPAYRGWEKARRVPYCIPSGGVCRLRLSGRRPSVSLPPVVNLSPKTAARHALVSRK